MRRKHVLSLAIVPALVAVAPVVAENHATTVSAEMTAYNVRYNEIAASYDLEAFVALYNKNPLWIAPTEAPVAGLDVPRNTFGFIKAKEGKLVHTADHSFVSADGTQAVLIGRYDAEIKAVGAKSNGTYLFVMQRNGDEWEIVVDMFNEHKPK